MIDDEVYYLISKYGFRALVAALARYANRPKVQEYPIRKFAKSFRDLNKLYEYLSNK